MRPILLAAAFTFSMTGPAVAGRMDFYSKLDLPVNSADKKTFGIERPRSLYIGSDKSYAAEPKAVRVIGRSFSLGLAIAGFFQPLGPVMAAGFLLIGAYNARQLAAEISSKPSPKAEYSCLLTPSIRAR